MNNFEDEVEQGLSAIQRMQLLHGILRYKGHDVREIAKYEVGQNNSPAIIMSIEGNDLDKLLKTMDELDAFKFEIGDRVKGPAKNDLSGAYPDGFEYIPLAGRDPVTDIPVKILFGRNIPSLFSVVTTMKRDYKRLMLTPYKGSPEHIEVLRKISISDTLHRD